MYKRTRKFITGFSLIELSMIMIIIGIVVSSVVGGRKLIWMARVSSARQLTNNASFVQKKSLVLWLEPTLKESFDDINDGIGRWNNLADKNINPLQATGDNQPAYVSNGIGELPSFRFDGINDYLEFDDDSVATMNPAEFTIFVVCSVAGSQGTFRSPLTSRSDIQPAQSGYMFYASNGNKWSFWIGTGSSWSQINHSENVVLNSPVVLIGKRDDSTTSLYVNDIVAQSTNSFERNKVYPARIGAGSTEETASNYFIGDVSEIIIFNEALNDTERTEIYNYLIEKYDMR